ncbi:integrase [Mycobacterium intermedium]|uniref:Integrase n=1 Tax=Mycobacterium intermedium TaxID=28445 RepID=A0A1E3S051_MYCIE|nr:tyrosine-type recombinase/integrase [Mycobacterium intermedium]MCV6965099.1 tyrosine-type recombinase/integrase [Mycobacterium intermedium]ODQ95480.1 integrase [Mycobacterium intermedium]OPE45290.1 integrase [Mycobacterium intermedium]ORA89614.1 integrase [Mycobacterium intermedium]
MTALAPTLQAFFTDRLRQQRHASDETVRAYRDTWRLLLGFATARTGKQPSLLGIDDIDSDLIAAFLDHLEHDRHNSVRTRNARLSAIHSLFHFAAPRHPEHAATISRVLAMPSKRFERALVTYLTVEEVEALLAAPDPTTRTGRRDRALILLMVQTGLRISELIMLRGNDIHLGAGAHVACHGKGRKDRITPLTKSTINALREWMSESSIKATDPIFPTRTGKPMSRDAIEHRLTHHQDAAALACPSLNTKHVTAHVLRHTAAMRLLEAGVDTTVIALWLGHERVDTTAIYLHAHLDIKEKALARTTPPNVEIGRYRPKDTLLAFLETL